MKASRDCDQANQKIRRVLFRLDSIEKEQRKVMADLREYLPKRADDVFEQLFEYVTSEEIKERFTKWTLDEVPKTESTFEETNRQISNALLGRLREIVEQWEEDNQVFANARESLVQMFQQRCSFAEGQLLNLQNTVTADCVVGVSENDPGLERGWTLVPTIGASVVAVLGATLVGFAFGSVPLGFVFGSGLALKVLLHPCKMNEFYEVKKDVLMTRISADFLVSDEGKVILKSFVQKQFKDAALCLKQIEARIPELIQADKMLYEQLIDEKRTQEEIQDLYWPIMNEGSLLRGQLAEFGIKEVCATDISSEELDWKEDKPSRLGCGAFGTVYQGIMRKNGDVKTVALKVCRTALDASCACQLMEEVELSRKFHHPNIVTFYGTSLLREKETVRMILVMERCKENLKSHILSHPESVPGKSQNPVVVGEASRWVKEITDALTYIHELGVVHRDLKLENILLSEENSVRIADVGLSKKTVDITGSCVGTPLYMAPEVRHSQEYGSKADIYSLGIMMWEMWYGRQAFADVQAETRTAFFSLVDAGYRPEHVQGCKEPPICWKQLMEKCWRGNPEERPSAETCTNQAKMIVFHEGNETEDQSVGF